MNVLKIKETTHNVFIVIITSSNDCMCQRCDELCETLLRPTVHVLLYTYTIPVHLYITCTYTY